MTKAFMWQNFRWVKKETKMKTKNCFHFPPTPLYFLFSPLFFDRELVWPRSSNFDNVEDNTTYYTHYIRWIIEPKSKQKTTCYYNYIQQKLKNEMKKPDVCLKEKTKKNCPPCPKFIMKEEKPSKWHWRQISCNFEV